MLWNLFQETLTKYAEKNNHKLLENAFRQLISTTKKLHKAGFAHMDIKPDNMIIDSNGKLYLVDLGISCFTDKECHGGTKLFLPPDLGFNDFSVKGRQQADVWAIGFSLAFVLDELDYAKDKKENLISQPKMQKKIRNEYLKKVMSLLTFASDRMVIFKKL